MKTWIKKYKKYILAGLGATAAMVGVITDWNAVNYVCWIFVFGVAACD